MDISRAKWLGLTGGIATGKTTACNYLREKSIPVIDADKIAHELLLANGLAVNQIVDKFGDSVLNSDRSISRPRLGEIVFKNSNKLLELNAIMHPLVRMKTNQKKEDLIQQGHKLIINDIPLLFENKLQSEYAKSILIYCKQEDQIKRLKKRNNFSDEEIAIRLRSQLPIEDKKEMADLIIDNSGSLEELYSKLDDLILDLLK